MTIRKAGSADIGTIHLLANDIWPTAYRDVISEEQISFMLQHMYAKEAIKQQMEEEGLTFLIAERNNQPIAFAAYSLTEPAEKIFKLHKIYVLPSAQGSGAGKQLIQHISALAKAGGGRILELNVNRANKALKFYRSLGFEIYNSVDIPYYQFQLNDYVMRISL